MNIQCMSTIRRNIVDNIITNVVDKRYSYLGGKVRIIISQKEHEHRAKSEARFISTEDSERR